MATLKITPHPLKAANIRLPPSKSHTMRALIFASMAKGKSIIRDPLISNDSLLMIEALRQFGALITLHQDSLEITGVDAKPTSPQDVIQAGNSGQILRFVGALAALLPTYTVITGDHSVRTSRPVEPLLSALTQLNCFASSCTLNHRAPILIKGPLRGGSAKIEGGDSQPISALLMACSFLEKPTHLEVVNPKETPWIDLTLHWIRKMGGRVNHEKFRHYVIEGNLRPKSFETTIAGDFSSAAFPLIAAIITRSVLTLENCDMEDCQGDKIIVEILQKMGASIKIDSQNKRVHLDGSFTLKNIAIDLNECIDALPILAVLGCYAEGRMHLYNGAIARQKECDRLSCITKELRKMGARIEEGQDELVIYESSLIGAEVEAHHDHRMAMALTVAAFGANGDSYVHGVECIQKSYPNFLADLQQMGAKIWKT